MPQTNPKPTVKLEIDALSYGPYGIGRSEGKAVMVPHTVPGDRIEARIVESKDRYALGAMTALLQASAARQIPPCPYVGACGGCSWQHIKYDTQLQAKQRSVADALRRIGKLSDFELRPIIPSPVEYHYRRRIRLQLGEQRQLGFFGAHSHQLIAVDRCLIADERVNESLSDLQHWARQVTTPLEHIEIVAGDDANELVAVAHAKAGFTSSDVGLCENLVAAEKPPDGLILRGKDWRRAWGRSQITVRLSSALALAVEADSFSQVHPDANRRILRELLGAAELAPSDRVLELFCGSGNFTLPMAQHVKQITAVEGDPLAIANARRNAEKYGLANIQWICSSVPRAIAELKRRRARFDAVVLDPPRAGAKEIAGDLAALGAKQILYVSCDPATLARDLAVLAKHGYKLRMVQPVDMFPQTFHVETLAHLDR